LIAAHIHNWRQVANLKYPATHMKAEFDPVIIGQAGSALCFSDL